MPVVRFQPFIYRILKPDAGLAEFSETKNQTGKMSKFNPNQQSLFRIN
jgi:hypothetical protein